MTIKDIDNPVRLEVRAPVGQQLFHLLRGRIVRGELAPGIRLSEVDLAAYYGTSRQPVREALIKLAEASLIEVRPQRGSYVSQIDMAAVLAAQFIREAVEADIVRCVALRATSEVMRQLDVILNSQADAAEIDDPKPFMSLDESFHRKLAEVAGQAAAWDLLQPLKTQMDRVRHLSAHHFPRRVLVQQHAEIVDALKAGDPALAESKMRHHLRRILQDVPIVAAAWPQFFTGDST